MDEYIYELPLSPNYVCNWELKEAIRELLQNAIDGENCGHKRSIKYNEEAEILYIVNENTKLSKSSLVLGCSSKDSIDGMIGKFGEGYKLALIVLLRKGFKVKIINADEEWTPQFAVSKKFDTQVLTINIKSLSTDEDKCIGTDLCFAISGINKQLYNELLKYFPCMDDNYGETLKTDNGEILFDKRFSGKMFVEGLYIQEDKNFKYGYNFNSDVVNLDRDRKAINYYELKQLTAQSIITAEGCNPELFKAISDSYNDIKDIKEVLDDANESFLMEYRDMLYAEKNLEEDTLVATKSVMKQLEQIDIDIPVIEGTEIESYLIAKANDKLGLIYEAQEQVNKKESENDAWYYVGVSNWIKLRYWMNQYGKRISKEGKKEFERIIKYFEPSGLYDIQTYIPEDFEWTKENFKELEEQYKSQED